MCDVSKAAPKWAAPARTVACRLKIPQSTAFSEALSPQSVFYIASDSRLPVQTRRASGGLGRPRGILSAMSPLKSFTAIATLVALVGLASHVPVVAQNKGAKTAKGGKGPTMVKGIPSAKAASKSAPAE